jgi:hypothetical protein
MAVGISCASGGVSVVENAARAVDWSGPYDDSQLEGSPNTNSWGWGTTRLVCFKGSAKGDRRLLSRCRGSR